MVNLGNLFCWFRFGKGGGDTESLLGEKAEARKKTGVPCGFWCRQCLDKVDPLFMFHLRKGDKGEQKFAQKLPETCQEYTLDPEKSHMFRRMLSGAAPKLKYPTSEELYRVQVEDIPWYCDQWQMTTISEPVKTRIGAVGARQGIPDIPPYDMVLARHRDDEYYDNPEKTGRIHWDAKGVRHFIQLPLYAMYDTHIFRQYWPGYLAANWQSWCLSGPNEVRLRPLALLFERPTLTPLGRQALEKFGMFALGRMNRVGAAHFADGEDTLGSPVDHNFGLLKGKAGSPRAVTVQTDALASLFLSVIQREMWILYRRILASADPEDFPVAYLMCDMNVYLTAIELESGKRRGRFRSPFPWAEGDVTREIYMGTKAWVAAYRAAGGREHLGETDTLINLHETNMYGYKHHEDGELNVGMLYQCLLATDTV